MKFHAFYIDNNLLIRIINKETTNYVKNDDVVALYHNEELIGFNILGFQSDNLNEGLVKLSQPLCDEINKKLAPHSFEELTYDEECYFVVGYVESIADHKESNKLKICQVDVGSEKLQIVCGAVNIDQGLKVVVAKAGAVLHSGLWIEKGLKMKAKSEGMICSKRELNMEQVEPGILVLDDSYQVGACFNV